MAHEERKIVYLESDEEIPSIVDRLEEEKTRAITLVVPKASVMLQSVINLKLLTRVAKKKKIDLALVSHDAIGRNLAVQVGIPVYDSINAKIPVLEPMTKQLEKDEVIELDESKLQPPVKVHHFQESEENMPEDNDNLKEPAFVKKSLEQTDTPEKKVEDESDETDNFKAEDVAPISNKDIQPDELPEEDQGHRESDRKHFREATVIREAAKQEDAIIESASTQIEKKQPAMAALVDSKIIKPASRKRGFWIGAVITLLIIALGILFFYPQATIALTVPGEDFNQSIDITGKKDQKQSDFTNAVIPAQIVEVVKDSKQNFPATGKKNVGQKAQGTVSFTNSWSADTKKISSGTRLTKDNLTFLTTSDITIPGATPTLSQGQVVITPGKINATIQASDAGDNYNIDPGRFTLPDLPSDQQDKIYAESTAKFTGGSTQQITVVSQDDVERAKESVRTDIAKAAKKDLADQAKGLMLLDKAIQVDTQSATPSVSVGSQADNFDLSVKALARGMAFTEATFRDVFLAKVKEKVPQDKQLILSGTDQDEIIASVKDLNLDEGKITITGSIKTKIGPKIDTDSLRVQSAGKKTNDIQSHAKSIAGVQDALVTVKPDWLLGRLPFSARQITVNVTYK